MTKAVSWLGGVLVLLSFVALAVGNVVRFLHWLQCRSCRNYGKYDVFLYRCCSTVCKHRRYCPKWHETPTEDELQELKNIYEDYVKRYGKGRK